MTGVQTCALPIWGVAVWGSSGVGELRCRGVTCSVGECHCGGVAFWLCWLPSLSSFLFTPFSHFLLFPLLSNFFLTSLFLSPFPFSHFPPFILLLFSFGIDSTLSLHRSDKERKSYIICTNKRFRFIGPSSLSLINFCVCHPLAIKRHYTEREMGKTGEMNSQTHARIDFHNQKQITKLFFSNEAKKYTKLNNLK